MTIDINKLRRLAQAATPGPWYATGKLTRYVEARIDGGLIQEVAACGPTKADGGYGPQQEANASLIAAANPATISELLDRLEAAEKECESWKGLAKQFGNEADVCATHLYFAKDELNRLRARIEEMERQEPVAQVGVHKTGGNAGIAWSARPLNEFDSLPPLCDGDKLYLAPGAQPAQMVVAYLDLGVGGYMDIGTDLSDEQLASLPKGRHMLGIVGTYGVDGYVSAQPAPSVPEGWKPIPEKHPTFDLVDLRLADGSVLCKCVPQSDGDYWWNGPSGEVFIDPKYAPATHWRLAATPEAKP